MYDRLKKLIANVGDVWTLVALGREFVALIRAQRYQEAEDKAIQILERFLPSEFTSSLDKLLDAILEAFIAGLVLYRQIMKMMGKSAQPYQITAGSPVEASPELIEACLDMIVPKASLTATGEDPTENPIVVIALIGLAIQIAEFIIRRRRERRANLDVLAC